FKGALLNVLRGQNRLVLGGSLHWIFHAYYFIEILHYFKILVPGGGIEPPQKTVRDSPILNIFVIG
uniref:hypothetical protein n=1 Tax=Bacteroides uniformis TaxID=820 RepID=UPI001E2B010D